MTYEHSLWNGFQKLDFTFEGHKAILVLPKKAVEGNKWLLKTEYFDSFPAFEIEMVAKGYHLAYIKNRTRFGTKEDCDTKAAFIKFLAALIKSSLSLLTSIGIEPVSSSTSIK